MRVYPRHRVDLSLADVVAGFVGCVVPGDTARLVAPIEAWWGSTAVVGLSVRTLWDGLLAALALPEGSEVIVSALTIPHMVDLVRAHGLVPVGVDLRHDSAGPEAEAVRAAITPRTRMILVAHLFGARLDLDPIAAVAAEHGVLLVEDCAQGVRRPGEAGHPGAAATLYSFGSIKTATALGGAVALVADPAFRERLRGVIGAHPRRPVRAMARKLAVHLVLIGLRPAPIYAVFAALCAVAGVPLERAINGSVRGFAEDTLLTHLRQAPDRGLLRLLARRLRRFDPLRVAERAARGQRVLEAAGPETIPGWRQDGHTWWLVPFRSPDPEALLAALWAAGFDASRGTTSLTAVGAHDTPVAAELLAQTVFLPAYPEVSERDLKRLLAVVSEQAAHPALRATG